MSEGEFYDISTFRFFCGFVCLFTLTVTYFGIVNYLNPGPSFQAYLDSIPAGDTALLNHTLTEKGLFTFSYFLQAVGGGIITSLLIVGGIKAKNSLNLIESIWAKLMIDEKI